MSLACDFRLASKRSEIGQPEIMLGLIPGGGGTQRLVRLIGTSRTKEMVMLGDRISAKKAGLDLPTDWLESHYLAGGRVTNVVRAMIAADNTPILDSTASAFGSWISLRLTPAAFFIALYLEFRILARCFGYSDKLKCWMSFWEK